MKNLMIALTVAFTASVSFANEAVNIKKVNKVIKSVVSSAQTDLINKIEVKFDEKSNLSSVEKLNTGVLLSATAKESAWSKKPSTVDVTANLKTLAHDAAHTKAQLAASIGSKTEALPLYAYIASYVLKGAQEEPAETENQKAFLALLEDATKTTRLDQIPNQLERLIVIIKTEIAAVPEEDDKAYADLMNSLKVDTRINNYQTVEVVLKTTTEVAVDFFDMKLLISDLGLKISRTGLSFGVSIAATTETEYANEELKSLKTYLSAIENADSETLAGLKDMAEGYVMMAESIVKGELDR